MLVKLFDGTPFVANMSEDEAKSKGYKLAVLSEKPVTEVGFHSESYWTEEAETCTQHWKIVADNEPIADDSEALSILLGGE